MSSGEIALKSLMVASLLFEVPLVLPKRAARLRHRYTNAKGSLLSVGA